MSFWRFFKNRSNGSGHKRRAQAEIARLVNLASSLLQSEHYVEARGLLLRALENDREIDNPAVLEWILMWLAMTWERTEEYQDWTAFFSGFLARNPNHVLALNLRAESHWYGGSLREAVADYTRSLELKPNDLSALMGRGQVLMELGDFEEALQNLNSALSFVDENPASKTEAEAYIRNGRAASLAGLGDFPGALQEFEKSISLCPENAWVYFNRAEAYRNHGDRVKATENYALALTKKEPKLTALKRAHAEKILNSLEA
jgi:tetratricopeptide (TPR) repeat protein